jgi:hypothetical protein
MDATSLILGALAVWRATHMLHAEAGPGEVFQRLREGAGTGLLGQSLACFYCLSLWLALPVAWVLGAPGAESVLLWLALSAAAILLERVTAQAPAAVEPVYTEDALDSDYPPIQPLDGGPLAPSAR